ncbi:MAG TPA: hypothetical protein VGC26_11265 [Afipia sp.]
MRAVLSLTFLVGALLIGTSMTALADTGPVIVIPGRPGVPVFINGREVSYSVVEGDWGRAKSFNVQPTVYGGWHNYEAPQVGHYYPSAGRMPGYGRYEVEPPADRVLPKPAAAVHESWSAQSAPPAPPQQNNIGVSLYPSANYPAPYPPPVIPAQPFGPHNGQRLRN